MFLQQNNNKDKTARPVAKQDWYTDQRHRHQNMFYLPGQPRPALPEMEQQSARYFKY